MVALIRLRLSTHPATRLYMKFVILATVAVKKVAQNLAVY